MAPTGASVGHVEREADAAVQHLRDAIDHCFGTTCLVATAPFVEPSAPELRAHLGRVRTQLTQLLELVVDVGTGTEIHRPCEVIKAVLGEIGTPVALEEREVRGLPCCANNVAHGAHVRLVLAIGAIFVLHLHHDDGTAFLDGEVTQLLCQLRLELLGALHEERILLAKAYVLFLEQPPGQTAHLPFGTGVRTGAHDDVHAILLSQSAESSHVILTGEEEVVHLRLVEVPEDVDAQRVHTEGLAHLYALFPVLARDAGIVHLGSLHDKGFVVEQEGLVAHAERTGLVGSAQGSCQAASESEKEDNRKSFLHNV